MRTFKVDFAYKIFYEWNSDHLANGIINVLMEASTSTAFTLLYQGKYIYMNNSGEDCFASLTPELRGLTVMEYLMDTRNSVERPSILISSKLDF